MTCGRNHHVAVLNRKHRCLLLALAMLLLHAILLAHRALCHSPVNGEGGHLSAGVSHLLFGRFDLFRVNPPLVRTLAAVPVVVASPTLNWAYYDANPLERREVFVEHDFFRANAEKLPALIAAARCACIPFSLIGGIVCYWWASRLYGEFAGLVALSMWCFSPSILGHASLMTPDAHAAAVGLAACYLFWRWLREPRWLQALLTGVLLGFAELCKFTLIVLYPTWLLLWLLYRLSDRDNMVWRDRIRQCAMFATIILVSLYVINAGYLFEGSFKRLGDYQFQTRALTGASTLSDVPASNRNRFHDTWLEWLPVPLPENYVQGIDTQRLDFERGLPSYLRGDWADHGWWYYYLYALAIKVPLGTWLLVALALGMTAKDVCGRRHDAPSMPRSKGEGKFSSVSWRDEVVVLVPGLTILIFVSSQTGFSVHSRYVLPALPFLFVWTSKVARALERRSHPRAFSEEVTGTIAWFRSRRQPVMTLLVTLAIIWSWGSSLAIYPHSLSYFNELAAVLPTPVDTSYPEPIKDNGQKRGIWATLASWPSAGSHNGPRHLLDSNFDWGQDLYYLEDWYESHPEASAIKVAYFGSYPLDQSKVKSAGSPPVGQDREVTDDKTVASMFGPLPGWYALSVNYIYSR